MPKQATPIRISVPTTMQISVWRAMWTKLRHKRWRYVLSALSAYLATLAPDFIRALVLLFAVVMAAWTFHKTEFGAKKLKRTAPVAGLFVILAVLLYFLPHLSEHHIAAQKQPIPAIKIDGHNREVDLSNNTFTNSGGIDVGPDVDKLNISHNSFSNQTGQEIVDDLVGDYLTQYTWQGKSISAGGSTEPLEVWVNGKLKERGIPWSVKIKHVDVSDPRRLNISIVP